MDPQELARLASRLLSCPTAPYHEAGVRAVVETICAEHGLAAGRDQWGNVIVRLGSRRQGRPIAFAAHLDHPGFAVERRLGPKRLLARFNGTVPEPWFQPGTPVLLQPGAVAAQVRRRRPGKEKLYELDLAPGSPTHGTPEFGVWDLPDFALKRGRIHARACDDLLGVTAALGALIDLQRSGAKVHALALLTRAEEVGFQGALALAASGVLPPDTLLVSLETSKELPPVRMGDGVIIRVGDRASTFGSAPTRFLTEIATTLAADQAKPFRFQRALMPGGSCEATAYQEFGFETTAACIALGNYHNCGPRERIAPEFVSLDDLDTMTRLLAAAAAAMPGYNAIVRRLPDRLNSLLRQARKNLRPARATPPGRPARARKATPPAKPRR